MRIKSLSGFSEFFEWRTNYAWYARFVLQAPYKNAYKELNVGSTLSDNVSMVLTYFAKYPTATFSNFWRLILEHVEKILQSRN
jgi:hypothetical protein